MTTTTNSPFLVSILMPAYNCEKHVAQAIDSIINQTYTNWELIISDDASKDKTKKIIDSYSDKRIKHFHNFQNIGYLETWNKLIKETKGSYITFMDSDDYSDQMRLEKLLHEFEKDTGLYICGSNYIRISENNEQIERSNFLLDHVSVFNEMPEKYHFIGSALMIKREVYDTLGGYHTFFNRMGEEDHYWVYLAMEKFKFKNISEHLYYYRFNANSVSGNLANNPSKLNSGKILETLIQQRQKTGSDYLQEGKEKELKVILEQLNAPYVNDPSYFYFYIAKRRFYEGHKQLALQNMWKAIKQNPFKVDYYRDFIYFLKKK